MGLIRTGEQPLSSAHVCLAGTLLRLSVASSVVLLCSKVLYKLYSELLAKDDPVFRCLVKDWS